MKPRKILCALTLCMALALTFGACTTPQPSTGGDADTAKSDVAAPSSDADVPQGATEGGAPKVYKLMGQQSASGGDWNDMWLFKRIEKELNIDLDITMASIEGLAEKKNLQLASGDYPDFYLAGILSEQDISQYGQQGVFLPLEDYINDEYTPNITAAFQKYPSLEGSMVYPDGHIYSVTGYNASPVALNKMNSWINVAWAEKLGVPVPSTLDEFYTYLKAVKEGDPNGNGEADEIPFSGRYDTYFANFTPVLTAMGMTELWFEVMDGKVQFNPAQPIFKEFLTYMNKLYAEGLMDAEYFTQNDEQFIAKQVQNRLGTYADYAHWVRMYANEEIWGQYDAWPSMTSQWNDKQLWPAYSSAPLGAFVITDKCKDPQDLMRLCNWFYDTTNSTYSIQGVPKGEWAEDPNVGYVFEEKDGAKLLTFTAPEGYADYQSFSHSKITADYGTFPNMPDFSMKDAQPGPQDVLENAVKKYRVPAYHMGWPTMKYTGDEADKINLAMTDVKSYADQMISKMIVGEVPISEFETYVKGFEDRNLGSVIEMEQAAYDRWAAAQNQ